jgi:hypothetical protein
MKHGGGGMVQYATTLFAYLDRNKFNLFDFQKINELERFLIRATATIRRMECKDRTMPTGHIQEVG